MKTIMDFINRLSKTQKITCLIVILLFALILSVGIPSLARYKNRNTLVTNPVWDGSVASSYKSGTGSSSDPYLISSGSELAYFYSQLATIDYDDTYFTLSNDIVLNEGVFNYDENNRINYILDGHIYYVNPYTNKYYDNVDMSGTEIGTVNLFNSLNNFKGIFDGNSFRIYGLYMANETSEELALFTNLQGEVKNLYVENAMIYGGATTAGIASKTNNASLSNILFNGDVVGKSTLDSKNINSVPTASIINMQNYETTNYIDLTNSIPLTGAEIISTSITGNYVIDGLNGADATVTINGQVVTGGTFSIDLGTNILNNVPVLTYTTATEGVTLTFSNLSYNIVYKYAVSAGIVAISNNTTIENTINKGSVYGYSVSGGLAGVTTSSTSVNQSYNTGDIKSTYISGGLVGIVEKSSDSINISKSYNTGSITSANFGGLIGITSNNTGAISISNSFNTSLTDYSIGTVYNSTVNITNSYYVNGVSAIKDGATNGNFVLATLDNLKTKSTDISVLQFNEFINFQDILTNTQNAWVYEKDSLPILFIDDINKPKASINVSVYSWNNLSYELNNLRLTSNITFSIEDADELNPVKEKYYYISNSNTPLTSTEISQITTWTSYSDIEQITTEGAYVIYVKVVDYDDNVTYLNTDVLVLDLPGVEASVNLDDNKWTNLKSNLDDIYIDRQKTVTVDASDEISGVSSIEYYITNSVLNTAELDALSNENWIDYSNGILIENSGKHVLYVKIVDSFDYVTYINTDYINLDGYTESDITIGRNSSSYLNADHYITDKSIITIDFNYSNSEATNLTDYTHNLVANMLLPLGTKLTLIDNVTKKVYEYKIATATDIYNYNSSCDVEDLDCVKKATYPFTLFKEIGTATVNNYYTETTYYNNGVVTENFTIVMDLADTDIAVNYNEVSLSMELRSPSDVNVRPTLYNTINKFNIYSTVNATDTKATLSLTTDYSGNAIEFNSNSTTNINLTSALNYKFINDFKIIDTTYEDKETGLLIRLTDSQGNTIEKSHLKNFIFKIGDTTYYPESDNMVHINLNKSIIDVTKTLTVTTYANNDGLPEGTYYLKISNYTSIDGDYCDELGTQNVLIPVTLTRTSFNTIYGFNVGMNDANRIISKNNESANVLFNISQNGLLINPNIRVSLYKKNSLTAYNQDYTVVDLASYVSDSLSGVSPNIYYVSTAPTENNSFGLNLTTASFENTGYKFVFELYDDTKKIGTIEKHFIVK